MRHDHRRATCTLATAATVLVAAPLEPVLAGQARGSLQVTVQVVAACGGSVTGGTAFVSEGCAPASAPLAIVSEGAAPADGDHRTTPPNTTLEVYRRAALPHADLLRTLPAGNGADAFSSSGCALCRLFLRLRSC